jgi:drug/metabolite transporter (DMT)-like permease
VRAVPEVHWCSWVPWHRWWSVLGAADALGPSCCRHYPRRQLSTVTLGHGVGTLCGPTSDSMRLGPRAHRARTYVHICPPGTRQRSRRSAGGLSGRDAGVVALLVAAAAWGVTYVIVKESLNDMPASDFLVWRFAAAVLFLALVGPSAVRSLTPAGLRAGVLVGLPLAAGYVLQTVGLRTTTAASSGFLTGLFVVFTPLLAACVLRTRVSRRVVAGVAVATAGLAVLCLNTLSVGWGELFTVLGAVAFAMHVLVLARHAERHQLGTLVLAQLAVVGAVSLLLAAPGGVVVPRTSELWLAVVVTALPCTVLAYWLQTWAQRRLPATSTAVVLTGEPVFAGLAAVWLGGEVLGPRVLLGGALIVTAMVLVEVAPRRRTRAVDGGASERHCGIGDSPLPSRSAGCPAECCHGMTLNRAGSS